MVGPVRATLLSGGGMEAFLGLFFSKSCVLLLFSAPFLFTTLKSQLKLIK
jgi:hypothetical protein